MARKQKRKGPGRPPVQKYFSGEELRAQARENIKASTERRLGIASIGVEDFADTVSNITGKHKFTREEMDEIREKADVLYNKYVDQKWEEEAELNKEVNAKLHAAMLESDPSEAPVKMMTEAEWHLAHGRRFDGSKRRGPAPKKKKAIWDLSPGEKGTAEKPGEPIDFETMEQEFEERMMNDYIAQRNSEPQQLVGKRLRKDHLNQPRRAPVKSFWI